MVEVLVLAVVALLIGNGWFAWQVKLLQQKVQERDDLIEELRDRFIDEPDWRKRVL